MMPFLAGVMPAIYVAMQAAGGDPAAAAAPATGGAGGAGTVQSPFGGPWYVPLLGMLAVFYLLVWRPQAKQRKEEENWRSSLKRGDEVVTSGGLIGKISGITDQVVTLELQEKVRVRVLRTHVIGKPPGQGQPAAAAPAAETK